MRKLPLAAAAAILCLASRAPEAVAADNNTEPQIPVELNKLEPIPASADAQHADGAGPGCRVYFVVSNPDPEPITQLRLDLILFGTDGVVSRRLAFDLGPLPARKTAVRLFDQPGLACDSIGRVLINDVLACQLGHDEAPADQQRQTCLGRLRLSSRTKSELMK
jgi:hypothetical protein